MVGQQSAKLPQLHAVKITVSGARGEDPKRYESESHPCNSKRSVISKTSDRYVKIAAWSEED
jgi:hypothetical protein